MSRQMIVITKDYLGSEYEEPDVYPVDDDNGSDGGREHASAVLGMLYRNYLEEEERETAIPIDHKNSFCMESDGYAQITWENGDIHRYFLVDVQDIPENDGVSGSQANTDPWREGDIPSSGQILSVSTVHILPETVDFLSVPRNSDVFQVFPNKDGCVMHFTDADKVSEYDLPLCIKDCIWYAWKRGCPWIYFGTEGHEYTGLPTYRFVWDKVL